MNVRPCIHYFADCLQLVNVFIDAFAGFIPILGNMVDFAFKSNLANLGILENHLRHSPKYVRI